MCIVNYKRYQRYIALVVCNHLTVVSLRKNGLPEHESCMIINVALLCFHIFYVWFCLSLEFQGEKNNGFDVLYHNMKHGQISTKELADFIRERYVFL